MQLKKTDGRGGVAARDYAARRASYLALVLQVLALLWVPACLAEQADRDKPVHLEADQVVIDDARQTSTFIGNVRLSQGTMSIRGDRIVVVQDKEGFKRGTAYGKEASFRQKREGLEEYVEGYGERIEYDTQSETVEFFVGARLKRNLDEVSGEHITYNAKTEIFQVNSGGPGAADEPPKRVQAILQPKPREAKPPAAGDGMPGARP